MTHADARKRTLVVSPHLDDAVFSCGEQIAAEAGAVVMTVFAGTLTPGTLSTEWDRRCGFRSARMAMTARRLEDKHALHSLQANPLWLDFLDDQYGGCVQPAEIAMALLLQIARHRPDRILFPLGLFHSDHRRVRDACILLARRSKPPPSWIAYEDIPYRRHRGELQEQLAGLQLLGCILTPVDLVGRSNAKARAVNSYQSQLRALGPSAVAETRFPERYWQADFRGEA